MTKPISMKQFLSICFFLIFVSVLAGQNRTPMENYAISLQKRIIDLDKKAEDYQIQLRYYQGIQGQISRAKQKVVELKLENTKNEEQKKILADSLRAVIKHIEIMEGELTNQNKLLKTTMDSLTATLMQLNKAKATIDSLVKTNVNLRAILDDALKELSEIQEITFGVLRTNGTFAYRVEEQKGESVKQIFLCPKEISLGKCNLTHIGFQLSIYNQEDLSNNNYVLIVYQKNVYDEYEYHTHLRFGFTKQVSHYEGYFKFISNLEGHVKLEHEMPSGREYVVGVMEFRGKVPDMNLIKLPFGKAKEMKLLIRTKP
jgi:hypothetical protein